MRLYRTGWLVFLYFLSWVISTTESTNDWSPEFLKQTRKANCILGNIQHDVTFLHGTDSGNFKELGKVADMDVCALLCCEMETCEAAFLADKNCYAVECHSPAHCATAPAHKNKWHPLVVFIKKFKKSQTTESKDGLLNDGNQSKDSSLDSSDKTRNSSLNKKDKANDGIQKQDDESTDSKTDTNKSNIVNILPSKMTDDGMKLAAIASDTSMSGDKKVDVKLPKLQAMPHQVVDKEKLSKIPATPLIHQVIGGVESLAVPLKSKIQTLQMEEANKNLLKPKDKHKTWRQRKLKESRDSLVSAAVVTCSMAFLLSFAAVIAAKIRKHKEGIVNPEYSSVPHVEDHN